MRAAAYLRVSTAEQTHDSQRAEVEAAAVARGDRIARWYVDTVTGRVVRRPALDELRRDVAAGRWNRIYTYRLDRMARLRLLDAFALLAEFERGGAHVVAVADRFDFADPVVGDLLLALALWIARREAETISERVRAGMRAARARGIRIGRPRRAVDAARARRLLDEGCSLRRVARVLGVPVRTLSRALAAQDARRAAVSPADGSQADPLGTPVAKGWFVDAGPDPQDDAGRGDAAEATQKE